MVKRGGETRSSVATLHFTLQQLLPITLLEQLIVKSQNFFWLRMALVAAYPFITRLKTGHSYFCESEINFGDLARLADEHNFCFFVRRDKRLQFFASSKNAKCLQYRRLRSWPSGASMESVCPASDIIKRDDALATLLLKKSSPSSGAC